MNTVLHRYYICSKMKINPKAGVILWTAAVFIMARKLLLTAIKTIVHQMGMTALGTAFRSSFTFQYIR